LADVTYSERSDEGGEAAKKTGEELGCCEGELEEQRSKEEEGDGRAHFEGVEGRVGQVRQTACVGESTREEEYSEDVKVTRWERKSRPRLISQEVDIQSGGARRGSRRASLARGGYISCQ
jgi:hypothetical protein